MPSSKRPSDTGIEPGSPVGPASQADSTAEPPGRPSVTKCPPSIRSSHIQAHHSCSVALPPCAEEAPFRRCKRHVFSISEGLAQTSKSGSPCFQRFRKQNYQPSTCACVSPTEERSVKEGRSLPLEELCRCAPQVTSSASC